jgi:hypothetical protein
VDLPIPPLVVGVYLFSRRSRAQLRTLLRWAVRSAGTAFAIAVAPGEGRLPLLLLFLGLMFLLMQRGFDRCDPRLALAWVAADDSVEFLPPPSRGARR